jgi:uncharacterized protein YbbK (DUF523 family)
MTSTRPAVLVSACLVGVACNYKCRGQAHPAVTALAETHRLIPVCPEVAGGLPTPRPAAEICGDGRVRTASGEDVTEMYERGSRHALEVALATGARRAVLKARSPSCGSHQVYDGSHSGVLVAGQGLTCAALRAAGVDVVSEEDLPGLPGGPPG